jgi:hypothetical protein
LDDFLSIGQLFGASLEAPRKAENNEFISSTPIALFGSKTRRQVKIELHEWLSDKQKKFSQREERLRYGG